MTMLAEVVDAVVGGDTHRDSHALELVTPNGVTLASTTVPSNEAGFAQALAWIAEHSPGTRVVTALEGTRSYGLGLSRAVQAAGIVVIEVQPSRRSKRRQGSLIPSTPASPRWKPCG